ncbi:uncharacterized protein yc1106_05507 [Curvularia clavata]|uniref:Uncharacterized protein n=1 Tax=Curvularia clavata TaxID=95742 RepID=A0A9Q9DS43_CURCL|nr:uncharacterized protein yc1106_05507 [Curvularia clavata]
MSQPSFSFGTATEDEFLPPLDQEQLSQADFQELFGSGIPEEDFFSVSTGNSFDGSSLEYDDVSTAPIDSVSSSAISTPNFSNYSFGQNSPAYSNPRLDKPHTRPFEPQRAHEQSTPQQTLSYRPRHTRQYTNHVHHYATPLPQPGLRRRSLSHSDVDRIATSARMPNPTFVRLQAPRCRTPTHEELRRGELSSHCRSNSFEPRGRSKQPTSSPYSLHSGPFICGMLPTPIGTPLNEVEDKNSDINTLHYHHNMTATGVAFPPFSGDPVFRQMSRPEELARSKQIIEIGALAVTNQAKIDPRLEPCDPIPNRDLVLKKLVDIEEHVKKAGGAKALDSCKTIRKVLTGKTQCEGEMDAVSAVLNNDVDASKNVTTETYSEMFDGHDENEIMDTLMKQHATRDISVV